MTDDELEEPRCPVCDGAISNITIVGPGEVILAPCGHWIPRLP